MLPEKALYVYIPNLKTKLATLQNFWIVAFALKTFMGIVHACYNESSSLQLQTGNAT